MGNEGARNKRPAWMLHLWYRDWLARNREQNSNWFQTYDRLATGIAVRIRPSLDRKRAATQRRLPVLPPVPAVRFGDPPAWRPIFEKLNQGRPASARPRISILTPAWNTKPNWFAEAAVSVLEQTFTNWEWIAVDDGSTDAQHHTVAVGLAEACPRFHWVEQTSNAGISGATNIALRMARGEYVCMLDHDDVLHPEALQACIEALERQNLDAVYTDSDKINEFGKPSEPFFKPAWSPDYFRGVMYVGHLLCVRRDAALAVGGFDSAYDGVQDYEFFLRYSERYPKIGSIPRVLYHWRTAPGSIASAPNAKDRICELHRRAARAQLARLGLNAIATPGRTPHRVSVAPGPRKTTPRVTVVIPTRDAPAVLEKCLDSLQTRSTYRNLQILCADHETSDSHALKVMSRPGVDRVVCRGDFNYARINNEAIRTAANGDFLVLMNNDVEVITAAWVEEMLYYAEQPDVGAVGALLLYPNGTVQHAGVALGFRGTADHLVRNADPDKDGYAGSLACAREVSAVTAACLMVRRSTYDQAGGLNEYYRTLYQDVDFCLRLRDLGKRNIFTPRARLYHHESYSRKSDYNLLDRALMVDTWDDAIKSDPYFNPNFSRESVDYQIAYEADRGQVRPGLILL